MESVKFLAIGSFLVMSAMPDFGYKSEQAFEVKRHVITVDEWGFQVETELWAVDDDAEYLDQEPVRVNLDLWDYTQL